MKFGIREVCDVTFTKLAGNGPTTFTIDTAKMSTLEGSSSTSYAQGGKGNSRLIAWEGEKNLTFTIEDALMSLASFAAITGADVAPVAGGSAVAYKVASTSFAGYYAITAKTLFRDENGNDHPATIEIPKAKLQTSLNLTMSPSGDPSAFTFTFDVLPKDRKDNTLFELTIEDLDDSDLSEIAGASDGKVFLTIWYQDGEQRYLDKEWTKATVTLKLKEKEVSNTTYDEDGNMTTTTKTLYTIVVDDEEILNFNFDLDSDLILNKTTLIPVANADYVETLTVTSGITYAPASPTTTITNITVPDSFEKETIINIPSSVTTLSLPSDSTALQDYTIALGPNVTTITNPIECAAVIFYGSEAEWELLKKNFTLTDTSNPITFEPRYNPEE